MYELSADGDIPACIGRRTDTPSQMPEACRHAGRIPWRSPLVVDYRRTDELRMQGTTHHETGRNQAAPLTPFLGSLMESSSIRTLLTLNIPSIVLSFKKSAPCDPCHPLFNVATKLSKSVIISPTLTVGQCDYSTHVFTNRTAYRS